ncbi:hypothetical protein QR680_005976 [Steinernema hermaphroditum]|uniref:Cytochrome P450 n=1 Tax=Steinernema hermaphroditum TaxID=289476 RepID=A0AA39LVS4_9BILA|nr:hypothetical protein QR680_005976 [Steinernema hermaphroditum]
MALGAGVLLVVVIAGLLFRLYSLFKERQKLVKLIDQIPGPPAIPILGCAYAFKLDSLEFVDQLEEWGRKYVMTPEGIGMMRTWIGPFPVVLICGDEAAKKVLENSRNIAKPSLMYSFLRKWTGTGLLTSDGGKWHSRRKILTPAFHFSILNSFVPIFSKQAEVFVEQIEKFAGSGEELDLFPFIKRCALDIICETAMGAEIGAQRGRNSAYVDAVATLNRLIWHHERLPWMWLKPVWYLSGNGFAFDAALTLTTDFTRKIIAERRKDFVRDDAPADAAGKQRLAFLDLLLSMQAENRLSDEDIREEVDTFMFAGHDTTASAVGFTIWLLAQNADFQEKVHAEVDDVFGDSDRPATSDDLRRLRYLEMCIKESLRFMPPIPVIGRVLSDDLEVEGRTIPKGITVVVGTAAVHRDPKNYSNPEEFDPENFTQENIAKRHPHSFIPFAAGPRNCIGQKFALLEEKAVLSTFFRRYRVTTEQNPRTNKPLPEIVLTPSKGFMVRVFERNKE